MNDEIRTMDGSYSQKIPNSTATVDVTLTVEWAHDSDGPLIVVRRSSHAPEREKWTYVDNENGAKFFEADWGVPLPARPEPEHEWVEVGGQRWWKDADGSWINTDRTKNDVAAGSQLEQALTEIHRLREVVTEINEQWREDQGMELT
jgi:hypothetical protein